MKIDVTRADVIWSYVGMACRLGVNFAIIPVLLLFLSDDEIGLWYVFISLTALTTILQLGFAPAIARNVAYCFSGAKAMTKEGTSREGMDGTVDWELFSNIILLSKRFYRVIALVALGLLLSLGSIYISYVVKSSSIDALFPWLVFCMSIFLNLYFTYYESLLRGIGQIASINKAIVLAAFAQLLSCLALAFLGLGLLAPVIAYALQGISFRLICGRFFWDCPAISGCLNQKECIALQDKTLQKSLYRSLAPNAYKDGLVSLSAYLQSQSNTIICSLFLSLAETGIFSLSMQVVNAISTFASVTASASYPAMQSSFAEGNKDKMARLIGRSTVAYIVVYLFGVLGTLIFIMPLIDYIKPDYTLDTTYLLVAFLYYFIIRNQSNFAAFISCTNKIPYVGAFLLSSALGVILTVVMTAVLGMGMWGLIFGQLIVQISYNSWAWVRYVCKMLDIGFLSLLIRGAKSYLPV